MNINIFKRVLLMWLVRINIMIIFWVCFIPINLIFARPVESGSENGLFFIRNYLPKTDYKSHAQNWACLQDNRGIMYFANTSGILEYDGVNWRLIPTDKSTHVRSLDMDNTGKIFIGAYGEMGFLASDSLGQTYFSPITYKIDSVYHDFLDVWKTICINESVYFSSYKYLFRWSANDEIENGGRFKVWETATFFQMAFSIQEKLYIQVKNVGLMELVNDSLQLIPGGEVFNNSWIFAMIEQNDGKILIVDRTKGLYTYNGAILDKLNAPADQQIIDSRVFYGIALPDGNIALATNLSGILIIDKDGSLVKTINKDNGLQHQSVTNLYLDREAGLWATLSNGIDRIEVNSFFSRFDNLPGQSNAVQSIIRHRGKIYLATGTGVYFLENQFSKNHKLQASSPQWTKVVGIDTQCWSFASMDTTLLVASNDGLFAINNDIVKKVSGGLCRFLSRSLKDPSKVFASKEKGIAVLSFMNSEIHEQYIRFGISDDIIFIDQDQYGMIWCSTLYHGIYRIPEDSVFNIDAWELLGIDHGLPALKYNTARMVNGRLLVSTQKGVFAFDENSHHFVPDSTIGREFTEAQVVRLLSDFRNDIWIQGHKNGNRFTGFARKNSNGGYTWKTEPFNRLLDYSFYTIYPDSGGVVWLGGPDGLIRYDPSIEFDYKRPFNALIRNILVRKDSLLHSAGIHFCPEIDYNHNAIRFEFAAPSYNVESANQYSWFLEGVDKGWSAWTTETWKDYNNLLEGKYQFRVKAKNIYNQISAESVFEFSILSPWYRNWWAYAMYIIAGGAIVFLIAHWRSGQIRREKEKLEIIVSERTQEVAAQADLLRSQAAKLTELDHIKTHFFTNISHEFRTPLTIITGLLHERITSEEDTNEVLENRTMYRSAKRLENLINQLLDLSKLEAKSLKLLVSMGEVYGFLRAIGSAFISIAYQKNIYYRINIPKHPVFGFFDEDKLEKIVSNLLSNAFKFTPDHGAISLNAHIENSQIFISVEDNGIGMEQEELSEIFNRFYQINSSHIRSHEGTGIGLALVKELIELHHGTITVESSPKYGSIFEIILPLDKEQYALQEINKDHVREVEKTAPVIESSHYSRANVIPDKKAEAPIVLIVEDNSDLRHFIVSRLNEYRILEAADGVEGLKIAGKYIPDVVITDVMMPKMDGSTFVEQLKNQEATGHIPVIMLTAKADMHSRIEGLESGADNYLTKPFEMQELKVRLKNLIGQRKKLRERFSRVVILKPKEIAITSADERFLEKVMAIIETQLDNSEFTVDNFQKEIGMSRMQLHRKLKALTDHSTGEFVRIQRLARASEMLSKTHSNISEVCYQTGFTSLSYFAKCFKKQFGITPKSYAEKYSQVL